MEPAARGTGVTTEASISEVVRIAKVRVSCGHSYAHKQAGIRPARCLDVHPALFAALFPKQLWKQLSGLKRLRAKSFCADAPNCAPNVTHGRSAVKSGRCEHALGSLCRWTSAASYETSWWK